ncbi:hypothetical protein Tco_1092409 [Tanacetum coccineum]|uniref:Reverse transcriptase domain-containing protein n=1 Tax=Tanacetum coccineum TaxID=301880 RepID=A0ABQ5I9V9_9ASTR
MKYRQVRSILRVFNQLLRVLMCRPVASSSHVPTDGMRNLSTVASVPVQPQTPIQYRPAQSMPPSLRVIGIEWRIFDGDLVLVGGGSTRAGRKGEQEKYFPSLCCLKAYPLAKPVAHKKRPLTPDRRQALKEEVFNWLKEGIIRKVQYPGWVTNAMLIKQKSELKNSVATLQRMEEKNGRNIEVYLEEIVMKNRSEQSLIQDVEETVDKLRRVNVKIDPSKCTFRMEEGKFLGYVMMKEGIRGDPEKNQAILRSPAPRGLD